MGRISESIAALAATRAGVDPRRAQQEPGRLTDMPGFGSNPGKLQAKLYVPDRLPGRPALVVVLHGCTQSAAAYDLGSGWSRLADEQGFVLLFPEQQRANNPNLCFNWFQPQHTARGSGEALSIRQMIAAVVRDHAIDPARIFVTGLSAGGAMTSVMLAAYPEVFAGGAIIAGLPYGSAGGVGQALARMRSHGVADAPALGGSVRRATDHVGPWPIVSVWHGSGDTTVNPDNADAIVAQWRSVHELERQPGVNDVIDGIPRRRWRDAAGKVVIEEYRIAGMGHGTPIDTGGGASIEVAGPHMLAAGISSTRRIAMFWGLSDERATNDATLPGSGDAGAGMPTPRPTVTIGSAQGEDATAAPPPRHPVFPAVANAGHIIDKALRTAGLIR